MAAAPTIRRIIASSSSSSLSSSLSSVAPPAASVAGASRPSAAVSSSGVSSSSSLSSLSFVTSASALCAGASSSEGGRVTPKASATPSTYSRTIRSSAARISAAPSRPVELICLRRDATPPPVDPPTGRPLDEKSVSVASGKRRPSSARHLSTWSTLTRSTFESTMTILSAGVRAAQCSYSAAGTCSNGLRMSATMQTTSERSRHRHSCLHTSRLCSKGDNASSEKRLWTEASHSSKAFCSMASCVAALSPRTSGRVGRPSVLSAPSYTSEPLVCSSKGSLARIFRAATTSSLSRKNRVDSSLTVPFLETCCVYVGASVAIVRSGLECDACPPPSLSRSATCARFALSRADFCLPLRPPFRPTMTYVVDDFCHVGASRRWRRRPRAGRGRVAAFSQARRTPSSTRTMETGT